MMHNSGLSWISEDYSSYLHLRQSLTDASGGEFPYFRSYSSANSHRRTEINKKNALINFSGYDYLGLNQNEEVKQAAMRTIEKYGISSAASRLVSGEVELHGDLEESIASFLGTESAVTFVSGYGTNVTTISHLFGSGHTLFCDQLVHNSIIIGAKLSGADIQRFRHNDMNHLESLLQDRGSSIPVVIVEGLYSMDGDIAPLSELIELKRRYGFILYVDEAHSLGTIGSTGRGVCERYSVDPKEVDILMGTLSKTLASCGGYVAGSSILVEYLKHTAPGFVFSTGLPAVLASAAYSALELLRNNPFYVEELRGKAEYFGNRMGFDS